MLKENELKDALVSLTQVMENENRDEAMNNPLYDFILSQAQWIKSPDTIDLFIIRKVNKVIEQCVIVHENLDHKILSREKRYLLINLYTHWSYFDNNIESLCDKLYGRAFCADRSRWILKRIIDWCTKDLVPNMAETAENGRLHYWIPEFGSFEQWLNFVKGLDDLHYGKPDRYLQAYQELLTSYPKNM